MNKPNYCMMKNIATTLLLVATIVLNAQTNNCFLGATLQQGGSATETPYIHPQADQLGNVITIHSRDMDTYTTNNYLLYDTLLGNIGGDAIIASVSPALTLNWFLQTNAFIDDYTIDPLNNIIILGFSNVDVTIANTTYPGSAGYFMAKINTNGTVLQVQPIITSSNNVSCFKITSDALGNVFVGIYNLTLPYQTIVHNTDTIPGTSNGASFGILKYNNNLNYDTLTYFKGMSSAYPTQFQTSTVGDLILSFFSFNSSGLLTTAANDTLLTYSFYGTHFTVLSLSNDFQQVNYAKEYVNINNNQPLVFKMYNYNNVTYCISDGNVNWGPETFVIGNDTVNMQNNGVLFTLDASGNVTQVVNDVSNYMSDLFFDNMGTLYLYNNNVIYEKRSSASLTKDPLFKITSIGVEISGNIPHKILYTNNRFYSFYRSSFSTMDVNQTANYGSSDNFITVIPASGLSRIYYEDNTTSYQCGMGYQQYDYLPYLSSQNTTVTFTPSGSMSLIPSSLNIMPIFFTATQNDTVIYQITDNTQNCTVTDTFYINVTSAPPVALVNYSGKTDFCYGETFVLGTDQNTSYVATQYIWSNGDTTSILTGTTSGNYYCNVIDTAGCLHEANDTISVTVHYPPVVNISSDSLYELCPGDSLTLHVTPDSSNFIYWWNTGDTSDSIVVTQPGLYTVNVYDQYGCEGNDGIMINYACVGVKENKVLQDVKAFPNPATNYIVLSSQTPLDITAELKNINGQVIYKQSINQLQQHRIDISDFAKGFYTLTIKDNENNEFIYKIIIQP